MAYGKTYESISTRTRYKVRFGYVQAGRVNRRNLYGYRMTDARLVDPRGTTNVQISAAYLEATSQLTNGMGLLRAKCYDSLYRQASGGKRASAAITLLEWRSSLGMIVQGARAVAASARALRRGDIYGVFRELNIRDHHRAVQMKRQYDSGARLDRLWLELNLGWGPLLDDIAQACAVMAQAVPTDTLRVRASEAVSSFTRVNYDDGYQTDARLGVKKLQLTSSVVAINPNLLLAKQLGLTNPAHVAWDAVPGSFVLDWFLPIGKYLNSFDASLGVTLGPTVYSSQCQINATEVAVSTWDPPKSWSRTSDCKEFRREIGPPPTLPPFRDRLQIPTGSLWQAATTVALAVQQLSGLMANSRLAGK